MSSSSLNHLSQRSLPKTKTSSGQVHELQIMYVTRPRSLYHDMPGALTAQPLPDDPFSGHLVVTDQDSESIDSSCCRICQDGRIKRLPFPSDRILHVVHSMHEEAAYVTKVWFVPVLDHPLSANRYYVIKAKGRRKGEAYTCSREGDMGMCCCAAPRRAADHKTRPFDHRDRYQQFEVRPYPAGGFFARSVEWDGYPPSFLRRGGWEARVSQSFTVHLRDAPALREPAAGVPDLNFSLPSRRSNPILIGRWYCPFVFVKEDDDDELRAPADQMKKSIFYEISLKQWWEVIYNAENEAGDGDQNIVAVDARVKRLLCLVYGLEADKDPGRRDSGGFVWFRVREELGQRGGSVGLSGGVYEKMRWLQETRGWFDGERYVRVSGNKEIGNGGGGWRKFGCYVLVESFVVRRMDERLVINFSFKNTDRIACKWE